MNNNLLSKIVLVVLVTFGLVALRWRPVLSSVHSATEFAATVQPFLDKNGFAVTRQAGDQVAASRGTCDVIIKEVAPEGWHESQMILTATGRDLFFVTRGQAYPGHQPVWRTWSYLQFYRVMAKIGVDVPRAFVFGVSPAMACRSLDIDWSELTPA